MGHRHQNPTAAERAVGTPALPQGARAHLGPWARLQGRQDVTRPRPPRHLWARLTS